MSVQVDSLTHMEISIPGQPAGKNQRRIYFENGSLCRSNFKNGYRFFLCFENSLLGGIASLISKNKNVLKNRRLNEQAPFPSSRIPSAYRYHLIQSKWKLSIVHLQFGEESKTQNGKRKGKNRTLRYTHCFIPLSSGSGN